MQKGGGELLRLILGAFFKGILGEILILFGELKFFI